jgi:tetratricopeptide (TPR) repeat protein
MKTPTTATLILLCLTSPLLAQSNTAQGYYEQGNNYLKAERCLEAVEAFKRAIALIPASGAYNDLGRAYMCLIKYSEAEASFKQALRLKPSNVIALYNLGLAYAGQTKIEEAKSVWRELQPKDPELARKLQFEIGRASEADTIIASAKKALEEIKSGRRDLADGDKYREANDYIKAIDSYKKSIANRPSSAAYNGLGLAYLYLKQYPNAISAFQQAIHLEASESTFHYNLATVYFEMGQYEKSRTSAKESIRLNPGDADAINLLGVANVRLKQYPAAIAEFQEAIRLKPNDPQLHHNLGKTYFLMGRRVEAQRIYKKLLTLDKDWAQKLSEAMK